MRWLALLLLAGPAAAETLVATRTIRAQEIIAAADLALDAAEFAGGTSDAALLVGQEARVAIYAGRPVRPADVGPPAIVERNAILPLIYNSNGLTISTDGRALDRAASGEIIRVMNLSSRTTVTARIGPDGAGYVSF
ncbi:flagellar basal-body P-ring formation protein FlgA [Oceanicola granulosus HTCC2516]|uniref:Flagella basal body P-ring formation protein FlgA n=1 Tax=Oceanicola granulosus (strain ATCC BAA-861 / DSM 15982 / KCTC 12143 / HTCC2516) TaxID=314256 RepID=Q2CDH7_OCEGH|nr:flagellar basal body P-ring formation chaperone FlgA [Oceanicola granulosus]EAR50734.1 flagellar basal-body P-ring formation protein FlgA [Oceanicola granulosus HTCC2516]